MAVATIALLGPVAINGMTGALAPRDRVVLSALALNATEISSVERLADALWGPAPPPSWPKVVPGCIHRLRRTLGPAAIETTPYGYRLVVDTDEIDTRRFESLLRQGRDQLARNEPARAAYTLGEAVALWRGGAFPDLNAWEPGRIEAARLAELRLEAQECRIDAGLRAGQHGDMLAPATAAVAEAPLREVRWGLLALAQYRCGHQGEALQTLRRARRMLVHELGLDPGPDLAALETAILRQDAALADAGARADNGICPYLGLFGYDIEDAGAFFGREWEIADCVSRLADRGVLAVVGPSGSGKSSLVRAGVGAALVRDGGRPVVMTPGPHPMSVIAELDQVGVALIVDQFEEVFTLCSDPPQRQAFCTELAVRATWCRVVIAMRADHLGDLAAHPDLARTVERGLFLLGPMDAEALRAAITGPADRAGLILEPGLVDLLVREVEGEPGALPLLSHALRQTWELRSGGTLTVAGYHATGGIRGSVARCAEDLYESLSVPQRDLLRRLMLRLITTTADGEPIRTKVPRRQLITEPERERMVERLTAARLATTDDQTVQVAHECLARAWPRLAGWLDEDVAGLRTQRHLTTAADAWCSLGRPDSELYRGVRLAQVVDWREITRPTLTSTEADFIEAGVAARDAAERALQDQARQRIRVRRRNRLLVAGVVVVVAAALVAGLLALRQQRQREAADLAAQLAEANRLDAAAAGAVNLDEALLLAVEANRTYDSPETRDALAALLSGHPDLTRSLAVRDTVRALAVSPDGGTLLVGEGDTGTSAFRTGTLQRTSQSVADSWTIAYRPDGQQLLLAGRSTGGLGEDYGKLSAAVADPQLATVSTLSSGPITTPWVLAVDAVYSADGRHIAVAAVGADTGSHVVGSSLLWDSDAPAASPLAFGSEIPVLAVALSPDGSRLYALTDVPDLEVFDVATGVRISSLALPQILLPQQSVAGNMTGVDQDLSDTLEVSPDGSIVAIGENHDVVLLDAAGLTEKARLHGLEGRVQAIEFSPDGRQLAAGAVDHAVELWDVGSGGEIARLTGHGGAVLALAFSPNGTTLYSGGADRRVLVWDLAGSNRFLARVVVGLSYAAHPGTAVPSPDGRSVVFAGPSASRGEVQFLDVSSGRLDPATADPTGGRPVVWLPPGDGAIVTVVGDRSLRRWDRATGRVAMERAVATAEISALAADPAGGFVVVGDRAGMVQAVDAQTLKPIAPSVSLGHPVTALAVLPAGRAVALLDDSSDALIEPAAASPAERSELGVQGLAVAVTGDGMRMAVGGAHGEVGLYDLAAGTWIAPPQAAHAQYVVSAAFNGDGSTFVTTSLDGMMRIWDGRTGESIARVPVGRSAASAVLLDDGVTALLAGRSGDVHRIDTDFAGWVSAACVVAGRDLTGDEWARTFGDRPVHQICPGG